MTDTLVRAPHDVVALRNTFGHFATGVTVVTYEAEGRLHGATVNSFTSISLEPALLLVSFMRTGNAAQRLTGRPFAVNVLRENQLSDALHFAGKPQEGYQPEWIEDGVAPRLAASHAWFTCTAWREYDGGDHVMFVGEVDEFGTTPDADPLLFHRGRFAPSAP